MADALPADPPASEPLLARLLQRRHGTDRVVMAAFDTADPDRAAGYAKLGLDLTEGSDAGHGSLWVFPGDRRRGAGRALLGSCRSTLRVRGRRRLLVDAPRSPAAVAFAQRFGGVGRSTTLRTRIARDAIVCGAAAPAVSLIRWNERCPDEVVKSFAAARAYLDGPVNGQSAVDPSSVAVVRAREDEAVRAEHRQYVVAATVNGTVIGYSTMFVRAAPMADAAETLVVPRYRRRRVGAVVKAELLGWAFAENPGLQLVQAWNDEQNAPIVGLNRKLGHTVDSAWTTWEFPV
jgi:GNAT superfamily N-acetyltransferase